jgi:hypothetical protein
MLLSLPDAVLGGVGSSDGVSKIGLLKESLLDVCKTCRARTLFYESSRRGKWGRGEKEREHKRQNVL